MSQPLVYATYRLVFLPLMLKYQLAYDIEKMDNIALLLFNYIQQYRSETLSDSQQLKICFEQLLCHYLDITSASSL